jgi:hypothetical protein
MARQKSFGPSWELPAGATHGNLFIALSGDAAAWITKLDSESFGGEVPVVRLPAAEPQKLDLSGMDIAKGNYMFAVVAEDEAQGKFADPYMAPQWVNVPLDLAPLPPAFGGKFGAF